MSDVEVFVGFDPAVPDVLAIIQRENQKIVNSYLIPHVMMGDPNGHGTPDRQATDRAGAGASAGAGAPGVDFKQFLAEHPALADVLAKAAAQAFQEKYDQEEAARAGSGLEPILAYKGLCYVPHTHGCKLISPRGGRNGEWPPYRKMTAVCDKSYLEPFVDDHHHQGAFPPVTGCTCGIHCSREMDLAIKYLPEAGKIGVLAIIAIWGEIFTHEFGFRAQYAYPQKLYVVIPRSFSQFPLLAYVDAADRLAETYGVPAKALTLSALIAELRSNRRYWDSRNPGLIGRPPRFMNMTGL